MSHVIVWELEGDHVEASALCDDPDCINRYTCDFDCEIIYDVQRADDGPVSHATWNEDRDDLTGDRHEMHLDTFCNVVEYLNADTSLLPELHDSTDTFEIGRTEIDPVWQGEDGLTWVRHEPIHSGTEGSG